MAETEAGQGAGPGSKARPSRRVAQWVRDYARLPGIPDEYIGEDGPRPVWSRFFEAFGSLAPADIERRFGAADRHLKEAGVTYRTPGESADRHWALSHLPLLIGESDWQQLSTGIAQRAHLLELVLRDLYGEGKLVADGAIPAAAIAGSHEYLRQICGIKPPGKRYLSFYAADVGRGPDGRWWVLGDRTQAPSGAGYALENRLVLSRAFASLYKSMNVERVAPFFEAFRDGLRGSADRDEPRIGLLTPGAFSETYFEHATLARYLGFLLVEGDDLAVSGDRIHIRTVAGLKRLDVLLRRVDSNFLDPLELDASSHLGVPGLIDVLRKDGVVVANMPGSGVLEARALLGFLPSLCRRLLGETLMMPHIATWWCGQKAAREEVLSRLDEFAIEGAYGRGVPGFESNGPVLAGELPQAERDRLVAAINERGIDFVGQELVRLSTTPVWDQGRIVPRPFVLRVFAAATSHGWTIMPAVSAGSPSTRCKGGLDGRWCPRRRCLGRLGQGGARPTLLPGRHGAHPPHRRRPAEQSRRQPVLARPLSRARRSYLAAGARARHPAARRQGLLQPAACGGAYPAHAGDVGCGRRKFAHAARRRSRRSAAIVSSSARASRFCARPAHRDILARAVVPDAWQVITEMTARLAEEVDDPPEEWSGSTIGNVPIGQGIAVTPVQMIAAYGAIANRGVLIEPHLVDRVGSGERVQPVRRRVVSTKTADEVRHMLREVVEEGSGTAAQIPGYRIAGKTGTAAKPDGAGGYSTSAYVASFVGFVPAKQPRLVILVTVDEPRGAIWGGVVAAPAFAEIAKFALQYLEIPPD